MLVSATVGIHLSPANKRGYFDSIDRFRSASYSKSESSATLNGNHRSLSTGIRGGGLRPCRVCGLDARGKVRSTGEHSTSEHKQRGYSSWLLLPHSPLAAPPPVVRAHVCGCHRGVYPQTHLMTIRYLLMAVEIRVFLALDAVLEISGTPIAAGSNPFSFHARQSLDSKCFTFGIAPLPMSLIGYDGMLPL